MTTLAGGETYGSDDGTGAAASFNYPSGITSDGTNLYLVEDINNTIPADPARVVTTPVEITILRIE